MSAKFGPGGNSVSFYEQGYKSTIQAPGFVKENGLDAYEYEAGKGLTASPATLAVIGKKAAEYGVSMSLHTPYYISLSSTEEEKRLKSIEYLKKSAQAADLLGATVMVVHPGSTAKIDREISLEFSAKTLVLADKMLEENNFKVKLGLETMGKMNQLGTLEEIKYLCGLSERFVPVVDFGHINARTRGGLRTKEDYINIFKTLGEKYSQNLHCHFSKIEYTEMGEKRHLTLKDETFGPPFEPLAEAIAELKLSTTIICESNGTMTEDAMEMKGIYLKLSNGSVK